MSERNPSGDRGRWSPPAWPEEPTEARDDEEPPEATLFGPVTNERYPEPHWPGETAGPGSSVFEQQATPRAPETPHHPNRQAHVPPPAPTAPGYPPTAPQYPTQPPVPPYPDPTRPQPRLPDGGAPGRPYPPGPAPAGRRSGGRDDRRDDGRGRERTGRDRRSGGGGFPLGAGFLIGATGLVCFLLSLLVLPWFEAGGQEVTLADIRESFEVPATDPDSLPGADADNGDPTATPTTVADETAVPSPGEIQDAAEEQVRNAAAQAAAAAIDSGKARYLELYTETLWLVLAIAVGLAVLFSTILSPRSFALSLLLGFRRLSGFVTILAGIVHGAALWIVFTGADAPDPAFGVWLGVGGLAAVFLACIIGPKR